MIGVLFFRHGLKVVVSQKSGFGTVADDLNYNSWPVAPQIVWTPLSTIK